MDKKEEREMEKSYTAAFYLDQSLEKDRLYKTVILKEGEILKEPKAPDGKDGKVFAGWISKADGQTASFGKPVTDEKNFYAAWR